jgi:hypothetical protein
MTADDPLTLTPMELACMRCGRVAPMRFAGCCDACRDELRSRFAPVVRDVAAPEYEPKMNVTPNAVALKDE